MNWTSQQREAICARGSNILLSAAAGSGKTTVLVSRVLDLIENAGASIDRMLIVTFTRAASADMRAKLAEKLTARAAEGSEMCREQTLLLDRARITTLHGFCADFLRAHFEVAKVDPAFRVLDDAENRRIADDALDDAVEEAYEQGGAALEALNYGRGPKGVREMAEALLGVLEERPDPEEWLAKACRMDGDMRAAWVRELVADALCQIDEAILRLCQAAAHPGCTINYAAAIAADVAALGDMRKINEYDPLRRALEEWKPTHAKPVRGLACDQEVKDLRTEVKRIIDGIRMREFPLDQAFADADALRPELECLGSIALRAGALTAEKKAELSALSYSDLEHYTLSALQSDDTAHLLQEQYDYVFVDEYQDTSDVQEAIVSRIVRGNNLFMVGDVKQSIYRFRQAEPRLFLEKYDRYGRGDGGRLLNLTMNFRSDPAILNFVNRVFERAMHGGISEIVYDEAARLHPGRSDLTGGSVRMHLLSEAEEGGASASAMEYKRCEREAVYIACRIREYMRRDPSLRYRDFAVLTRTKAGVLGRMANVLMAEGIPAYADGTEGFFTSGEISLALSLLKLIANARSDVELIGVLRSPVVGVPDEELARIRIACPDVPFVDACREYARGEGELSRRLQGFFDMLSDWQLRCGSIDLGALVRTVLDESGFYDCAGAMVGGAQRQANLDLLVQNASAFDRTISGSLTRFLRHTERMQARGDGDDAHVLGENDDVVRLMTAHKSKGLEFPIVFGALLQRDFGSGPHGAVLTAHRDLGIGCSYCDPRLKTRRKTLAQIAIEARERREDAAEEKRVLYVLLTRAQRHLELIGSVKDVDKQKVRWKSMANAPEAARSFLDVIMSADIGDVCTLEQGFLPERPLSAAEEDLEMDALLHPREEAADGELLRELTWEYPQRGADREPLKLTVTGLLRNLQGPEAVEELIERPAFLSEAGAKAMTGAERGTAYHRAMELLNLEALRDCPSPEAEINRQLDAMCARRRMTEAQREAVPARKLARFFKSELGARLLRSEDVRREWSFNVRMRRGEALTEEENKGAEAEGELLVQGTIDCCFLEGDAWVLLDYKTDRETDAEALTERYERQLRMYALALERITGTPVRQIALYLLSAGEILWIRREE